MQRLGLLIRLAPTHAVEVASRLECRHLLELRRGCLEPLIQQRKEYSPQLPSGPMFTQQSLPSPTRYSVAGSVTGSDFNITVCINEKMAVVAPIPSASVSITVRVNSGDCRICRTRTRDPAAAFAW